MVPADNDNARPEYSQSNGDPVKVLSPAAQRARAEAEERRRRETVAERPTELGGRGGADPARFGDWEIKGRAIDF